MLFVVAMLEVMALLSTVIVDSGHGRGKERLRLTRLGTDGRGFHGLRDGKAKHDFTGFGVWDSP
jgi:hypothetical protein